MPVDNDVEDGTFHDDTKSIPQSEGGRLRQVTFLVFSCVTAVPCATSPFSKKPAFLYHKTLSISPCHTQLTCLLVGFQTQIIFISM